MSFDFNLKLTGIGPHSCTELTKKISSINMAIYADNGSGKSFISKSFKRITDLKYLDKDNQEQIKSFIEKSSAMIRFGETQGNVTLSIIPEGEHCKDLFINFKSNSLPIVSDNSGFIFHVFNSEYVRENLEAVKYHPKDKVSGFILGKANIDLSKEKEQLENYAKDEERILDSIKDLIKVALDDLKSEGVQAKTYEFVAITLESVLQGIMNSEKQSYDHVVEKYHLLKAIPDNLDDVLYQPFLDDIESLSKDLNDANGLICKEYTLSSFSDAFKNKFKENQPFIETGLQLSNGKKCPFCGQSYDKDALVLIDDYNSYIMDEESKIIKSINNYIKKINSFSKNLSDNCVLTSNTANNFDKIKKYFPSLNSNNLCCFDVSAIVEKFKTICDALETKKQNISLIGESVQSDIKAVMTHLKEYKIAETENLKKVQELNKNKSDISTERLLLRKTLCKSKFNQLVIASESKRKEIASIRTKIETLSKEIEEKESIVKIDKRNKLINKLRDYLSFFFKNKYEFDDEHFCVKYQNHALIENTDYVLSDGEKSILAFCFYLANIHGIVEKESDYKNLFLIIDDPVSSMDFNYVYNVAQVIRNIKKEPEISRVRYIILTHNMEFMSILVRNKIVTKKYLLSDGLFLDFKNDYIMPYASNLLDIYSVAFGFKKPAHTLPNQIRHVLETIYRFEGSPGNNFDDYIFNDNILGKDGCLYSVIEDLSHGGLRISKGYTDQMLENCCKVVVDFINNRYPAQISEINQLANNTGNKKSG